MSWADVRAGTGAAGRRRIHRRRGAPDSSTLAGMRQNAITTATRVLFVLTLFVVFHLATTDRTYPGIDLFWDKLNHVFAFMVLAALADRSFPGGRFGPAKMLALLGLGISIEVVQHFIPYREASALDVLADAAGIALYAPFSLLLRMSPLWPRPAKG